MYEDLWNVLYIYIPKCFYRQSIQTNLIATDFVSCKKYLRCPGDCLHCILQNVVLEISYNNLRNLEVFKEFSKRGVSEYKSRGSFKNRGALGYVSLLASTLFPIQGHL